MKNKYIFDTMQKQTDQQTTYQQANVLRYASGDVSLSTRMVFRNRAHSAMMLTPVSTQTEIICLRDQAFEQSLIIYTYMLAQEPFG